ncbi:Synerg-CTERM sorting domain-containing protein [Cloacibacillus evryensis]|uniref:Synerg-CTERM sorting domain-containing protein n=1 Tax=Cloacibacillus evryensis TaxID=508460 RepID=UPI0024204ECF|nr:Synerg-CTERM sorting domain-containing protein [Cloacibacillus evryensis]
MKRGFCIIIVSFIIMQAAAAFAVPANSRRSLIVTQPDGSTFLAVTHGDEFQNWVSSEADGYIVIYDNATKSWNFAVNTNGVTTASSVMYGVNATPPANAAKDFLPSVAASAQRSSRMSRYRAAESSATAARWTPRAAPLSGDSNLLVVRLTFENTRNSKDTDLTDVAITSADIKKEVFGDTLSVKKYYADQSKQRFNVVSALGNGQIMEIDVKSTDLSGDVYQKGVHPGKFIAYNTDPNQHKNEVAFVQSMMKLVQEKLGDKKFDFSKYDKNGDKKITEDELAVYFVLAGFEDSGTNKIKTDKSISIWAHQWFSLYGSSDGDDSRVQMEGGYTLALWAMNGEVTAMRQGDKNEFYRMPVTGTMCHELGHQLCSLPDLYDTSYFNNGVGVYSLMAGGCDGFAKGEYSGARPVNLDAWSRYYLGWDSPKSVTGTAAAATVKIGKQSYGEGSSCASVMVNGPKSLPYQYYLMEVRDRSTETGGWDAGLYGIISDDQAAAAKGVLLIHADETVGSGSLAQGNDINALYKDESRKEQLNAHQGIMSVWPYEDSRAKTPEKLTIAEEYALWYKGNANAKASGLTPDSAFAWLISKFYKTIDSASVDEYSGISLTNFSEPADEMTATLAMAEEQPSSGGSSGGCAAGAYGVVLLAAIPFIIRRNKNR